jgi:hypothetical protein
VRRLLATATALAIVAVDATSAPAAGPAGVTAEGTRITLERRIATMRVPPRIDGVVRLRIECGRGTSLRRGAGVVTARGGERVAVRLNRAVPRADFCAFVVKSVAERAQLAHGAARLGRRPRAVTTVRPGPGVRVGETSGGARFRLHDRRVTVALRRALRVSQALTVACGLADGTIGFRTVVADPGDRTWTVDLRIDGSDAEYCLIEDGVTGSDLAVAAMGPPDR